MTASGISLNLLSSKPGVIKYSITHRRRGVVAVNGVEAREFAEAWVVDARVLLDAGRWHAAYYLAGYAVECGLKACILAHIDNTGIIFQDKKFAEKCFTHDIETLVKAADLEITRGRDNAANPALALNWRVIKDWKVDTRYQETSESEAR